MSTSDQEEDDVVMRYPGARWDPLGPQTQKMMLSHDIVSLHTMVGTLAGTSAMFHRDGYGGTESHFGIDHDMLMLQWQDLRFRADANHTGAHRVISIECQDKGAGFPIWTGSDVPAFTARQIDKLVHCLTWLTSREAHAECPTTWTCHQVGIPRRMIPDTLPGRRGIAVHRQGIDSYPPGSFKPGWRQPNGELWSSSLGKVCPGDRRIRQTVEVIVPRLTVSPVVELPEEDDEMFLYSTPNQPVFFCDGGVSVGINEATDMPTFTEQKVKHFHLDDDTYAKFRQRYPGA